MVKSYVHVLSLRLERISMCRTPDSGFETMEKRQFAAAQIPKGALLTMLEKRTWLGLGPG